MKKIKCLIILLAMFCLSANVFAFEGEEQILEKFNSVLEKEFIRNGYSNLVIDDTLDLNKITLGIEHKLYNVDKNFNLVYKDMYITKLEYKEKEIANAIYSRDSDGNIVGVIINLNYADEKYDVILNRIYDYLNEQEIENTCIYTSHIGNSLVAAAFNLNDDRIKIVIDDSGVFDNSGYKENNIRIIRKTRFNTVLKKVENKLTALDITRAIFLISIVGLILNLFILYVHSVDKIKSKEVKRVAKVYKNEEEKLDAKKKK